MTDSDVVLVALLLWALSLLVRFGIFRARLDRPHPHWECICLGERGPHRFTEAMLLLLLIYLVAAVVTLFHVPCFNQPSHELPWLWIIFGAATLSVCEFLYGAVCHMRHCMSRPHHCPSWGSHGSRTAE